MYIYLLNSIRNFYTMDDDITAISVKETQNTGGDVEINVKY
jgi:hypothetical protein